VKLRGYLALALVCVGLLLADPVQRFLVAPWVALRPSRRLPVLNRWINIMAWLASRPLDAIGGAHIPKPARVVPARPGILILMNHQSLLDIPMLVQAVGGGYPRIVTRKRYGRWIPLISHLTRLYQYPLVDPTANTAELRRTYEQLKDMARTSPVPVAMFPEGTRTKNGEIARLRKRGLALMLGTRSWQVYVIVADGFWRRPRFKDFVGGLHEIRGRIELAGVLEWSDPRADPDGFMDQVHDLMVERLAHMRSGVPVA
jgi:1-acyl-sn-glycerol-3-phosphate acyltransferase